MQSFANLLNSLQQPADTAFAKLSDAAAQSAYARIRAEEAQLRAYQEARTTKFSAVRTKLSEAASLQRDIGIGIAQGALNPEDPRVQALWKTSEEMMDAAAEEIVAGDEAEMNLDDLLTEAAAEDPEAAAELISQVEGVDVTPEEVMEMSEKVAHVVLGANTHDAAMVKQSSMGWQPRTNLLLTKIAHRLIAYHRQGAGG